MIASQLERRDMRFVNTQELDTTIEALTKLRDDIKADKRIKMDNALALILTRAELIRNTVGTGKVWHNVLLTQCVSLAQAVKEYEKALNITEGE